MKATPGERMSVLKGTAGEWVYAQVATLPWEGVCVERGCVCVERRERLCQIFSRPDGCFVRLVCFSDIDVLILELCKRLLFTTTKRP